MKTIFPTVLLTCGMIVTNAATNELTGLMQKGLFEEEANHNLTAAIEAYQRIINRFDESRPVAATAIFRLGECYRKQGKTNEAANCYQRIIKEFSDQNTLLTLSEQNLGGLGARAADTRVPTEQQRARVAEIKKLPKEQQRLLVQQASHNRVLDGLMQKLDEQEQKLAADSHQFGSGHPEVAKTVETVRILQEQIDAQVDATLLAWEAGLENPHSQMQGTSPQGIGESDQENASSESAELRRIQNILKESPDLINAGDPASGGSLLRTAAANGQVRVVEFLLAHGAKVDPKDFGGRTPLHSAVAAGHKAVAEWLLKHGANVSAADNKGTTPLHLAAERGFQSIAELLLSHGANVNAKNSDNVAPLHFAVAGDNTSVVQLLLSSNAEPNALANKFDSSHETFEGSPLHVAVERNDPAIARLLIDKKAIVDSVDQSGQTPLDLAVSAGELPMARLLLDSGADPNFRPGAGAALDFTPLQYAVQNGQTDCVLLLLQRKADPNARCNYLSWDNHLSLRARLTVAAKNYTPLLIAVHNGDDAIVQALLDFKADPNAVSANGDTPLLNTFNKRMSPERDRDPNARALSMDTRVRMMEMLLDHGANPDLAYKNGVTPLMIATSFGETECVNALIAHKANPNLGQPDGETALHWAARRCDGSEMLKIAAALLGAGADPNPQTTSGNTPFSLVNTNSPECQKMADLLRQHGAVIDLPDFNSIRLTRSGMQPIVIWREDTNHINQFNLFETLLHYYWSPSAFSQHRSPPRVASRAPTAELPGRPIPSLFFTPGIPGQMLDLSQLTFPDLNRITIHRPDKTDIPKTADIPINIMKTADIFDCASNQPLLFGDVVEIPEREHEIAGPSVLLNTAQFNSLLDCATQHITFKIKSRTVDLRSDPLDMKNFLSDAMKRQEVQSLLTSRSDLTHVKIHRSNPASSKAQSLMEDVQSFWDRKRDAADDIWLRDGDVVEVPEKN